MLKFVAVPIATLRPLELRHRWLVQVFASFAGADGRCWPSTRALIAESGEHRSWVKRVVKEMLEREYITRVPRAGGGFVYTLAERFRPARGRIVAGPKTGPEEGLKQAPEGGAQKRAGAGPKLSPEREVEERESKRAHAPAPAPAREELETYARSCGFSSWRERLAEIREQERLKERREEERSALVAHVAPAHSGRSERSLLSDEAERASRAELGSAGLPTRRQLSALRGLGLNADNFH